MGSVAHSTTRKENMPTSIIVGAGWAGLTCAYELSKAGHFVQIIEAAPQIGGRARGIRFNEHALDNGQHLVIGAYKTLRSILRELNLQESELFKIMPMQLIVHSTKTLRLKLAKLPVPLNFGIGLLLARQIPWRDKLHIIKFISELQKIDYHLRHDCSVLECLKNYHQSSLVIEHLWEPIAVAAMTTSINVASAQVFINILKELLQESNASDWYFPTVDLSKLLPDHLVNNLQQNNGRIIFNQSVNNLTLENDQCISIASKKYSWSADNIVLATTPWQTHELCKPHSNLQALQHTLSQFRYEPITTVYLIFDQPVGLHYPMFGLINSSCHWIFDRAFSNQPNILSAVITGKKALDLTDKITLQQTVLSDLHKQIPQLPNPIACKIIREKRAAFSCDVATQSIRPRPRTSIRNLWLTGDYIQTGLPATLEGALLSGKQTAREIIISPRSNQNC